MANKDQCHPLIFQVDDDDDCLSLSDLPLEPLRETQKDGKSSEAIEEFEFRTLDAGSGISNADDIFFKGQLLPLRLSSVGSQASSRLENGRYQQSSCLSSSSRSVSRSHSSSSRSSTSNIFYTYPSPRPQVRTSIGAARRSTGSAPTGWAVFRLGIAKTPEIELNDLRLRRLKISSSSSSAQQLKSAKKTATRSMGFGCMCGPDAVEPAPMKPDKSKGIKRVVKLGLKREESMCRSRMIEWLEELSIGKGLIG